MYVTVTYLYLLLSLLVVFPKYWLLSNRIITVIEEIKIQPTYVKRFNAFTQLFETSTKDQFIEKLRIKCDLEEKIIAILIIIYNKKKYKSKYSFTVINNSYTFIIYIIN